MIKILKYSFVDLMRSRWSYVYFIFYLSLGFLLLFLNADLSKAVITLLNLIVILTPLIGTIFGIMYYYNSREFTELLLAQPIRRSTIFLGQYLGVALSLSLSLILGLGIPFIAYGLFKTSEIWNFLILLITGGMLTFIFVALSMNIGLANNNRIKGFGYAIVLWLVLAVIYDGLFLILIVQFKEYPLDNFALAMTAFNPIDLSRILVLLKLDISALLGFTGAVFQKSFGTIWGELTAFILMALWIALPVWRMSHLAKRKDF